MFFVAEFNTAHLASRLDRLVFPALVAAESLVLPVAGFVPLVLELFSAFQAFRGEPAHLTVPTHGGIEAAHRVMKLVATVFARGDYSLSVGRS
jgi:hypothetical protein